MNSTDMLPLISWFLVASFGLVFFYLLLLSLFGLIMKERREITSQRLRKFAVVVPAHNEEVSIARTVKSLKEIGYPRDHADIVVVADNCTDRTAEIAAEAGARVLERRDSQRRGKGFVLEWCFERLFPTGSEYDAVVVIDADSIVSRNFLLMMNEYLGEGHQALQAADVPEARPGVWSAEVVRVGMTLYNVSRPLGRKFLGFSSGLKGNGMCFSTELLRRVPWKAHSLTEDLQYGLDLLVQGESVTFVPEAFVFAAMPARLSGTQRERWEAGRISVVRQYIPKLLKAFARTRSMEILDMLVELLLLPFVNMFTLALLLTMFSAGLSAAGLIESEILWGWAVVLLFGGAHVVLGLLAAQADRNLFFALVYVPKYALWKLSVYANVLIYGMRKDWIRTVRE